LRRAARKQAEVRDVMREGDHGRAQERGAEGRSQPRRRLSRELGAEDGEERKERDQVTGADVVPGPRRDGEDEGNGQDEERVLEDEEAPLQEERRHEEERERQRDLDREGKREVVPEAVGARLPEAIVDALSDAVRLEDVEEPGPVGGQRLR